MDTLCCILRVILWSNIYIRVPLWRSLQVTFGVFFERPYCGIVIPLSGAITIIASLVSGYIYPYVSPAPVPQYVRAHTCNYLSISRRNKLGP